MALIADSVDSTLSVSENLSPSNPLRSNISQFNVQDSANRYTRDTVWKLLLHTAIPMLPGTLSLSGYNIANTYFLAKLGLEPLTAMGFVFPVVMLVGCVFIGLGVGVMTPMAQAIGRGDRTQAARIATSGLLLTMLASIVCGVAGNATLEWTFRQYGADAALIPVIAEYMYIWYAGCFTVAFMMLGNHLMIGSGMPVHAGLLMLFGMGLNVGLDAWFIFGGGPIPPLGVRGAALGTVLSQGIAACLAMMALQRQRKLFHLRMLCDVKGILKLWCTIIEMSIPLTLGYLLMPLGNSVIVWIISRFGHEAVAACTAVGRLEAVACLITMSLGMSLTSVVAQNFGAEKFDRIRQTLKLSVTFAFVMEFCVAIAAFCFARSIAEFFVTNPTVVQIMIWHLQIVTFGYGMTEIHRFSCCFLTGCSHPRLATCANLLRVVLLVAGSYWGAQWSGITGVFFARLGTDFFAGGVNLLLAVWIVWRLYPSWSKKRSA